MKIKELEEENNRLRQMLLKQQKPTYKKLPENNLDKF
jgi:cell shape-determining protein MreC